MSESNVSHAWIIFNAFFCICWGGLNVIFMFSAPAFCSSFRLISRKLCTDPPPLITEKGWGGGLYTGYFNDPIVVVYCTAGSRGRKLERILLATRSGKTGLSCPSGVLKPLCSRKKCVKYMNPAANGQGHH